MTNNIGHTAKPSFEGTIFQYYVALDKCFEMRENGIVLLEEDGDVSTNYEQLEVKHVTGDLTDRGESFWKTLHNWLSSKVQVEDYDSLLLLTTQKFGANTKLKDWNRKSPKQRLTILTKIKTQARNDFKASGKNKVDKPQSLKYIEFVLKSENRKKLEEILEKFLILDNSEESEDYYFKIRDQYLKAVQAPKHKNSIMNALLGFILNRPKVNAQWKVTYKEFSDEFGELCNSFSGTIRQFPSVVNGTISKEEIDANKEHLFVKKIEEIDYFDVITKAIADYLKSQRVMMEELSDRTASRRQYEEFKNELLDQYTPRYNKASRNANPNELIYACQDFYDEMTGLSAPQMGDYQSTPSTFKNGTLHALANEGEIEWKLKEK